MKTIFDQATREEIVARINTISEQSNRRWGKMTTFEMLTHCFVWDEWIQGKSSLKYKQSLLGRIFGKLALKATVGSDKPMKKGMPAGALAVKQITGEVEVQKRKWAERIAEYEYYSNPGFIHDFFGKMTTEEIGILAYKHADHHLRQFSC